MKKKPRARYVDGFVLAVPKRKLPAYRRLARVASKVWMEHGAVDYYECVGDDLKVKMGRSFTTLARTKPSETVVFSWISYRSRSHRNSVNAKVMKDPRIARMMDDAMAVFDPRRMAYGGFKVFVTAG